MNWIDVLCPRVVAEIEVGVKVLAVVGRGLVVSRVTATAAQGVTTVTATAVQGESPACS